MLDDVLQRNVYKMLSSEDEKFRMTQKIDKSSSGSTSANILSSVNKNYKINYTPTHRFRLSDWLKEGHMTWIFLTMFMFGN